ncbi:MAG: CRISPR-associated protein Cas4 [Bacteroides sp.]
MIEYGDENLLMLSGIQHIAFCERQWALIHIEQQWTENRLTVEGTYLHKNVDDPLYMNQIKDVVTLRSVSLVSYKLGLYGVSDVVELRHSDTLHNAITHSKYQGYWLINPVEYKHGKPKKESIDEVQLCAQAICLEEQFNVQIEKGWLYYGEIRRREEIEFTSALRHLVADYANRMHSLFQKGITPFPVYKPQCKSCSLYNDCLPKSFSRTKSVNLYLNKLFD